ncbi:Afadin [Camelus dromedarius]|uniref:Afadin n=1 Tax=Camelus dromedarius TaxID=9838 RepID=A0A5N4DWX4_CAMDR|nr:Afadin [Camelus dromedarius]
MLEWQFQKRLQDPSRRTGRRGGGGRRRGTLLLMQRLEAERRARLQDEERRRQQQLEEMRQREAEERARHEEERRRQDEERLRRDAEEKVVVLPVTRTQHPPPTCANENFGQHDEAERRLLEPEEPGLGRPPLPQGYEPLLQAPPGPAPPPPPQRTASYLQAQVLSPDSLYTAKLVAYNEEEEEDGLAGPDSYMGSSGTAIGAHDVCREPREKLSKSQDTDLPGGPGAPENLTFRERQRLFSQGQDVSNRVKASRKLTELENELSTK